MVEGEGGESQNPAKLKEIRNEKSEEKKRSDNPRSCGTSAFLRISDTI